MSTEDKSDQEVAEAAGFPKPPAEESDDSEEHKGSSEEEEEESSDEESEDDDSGEEDESDESDKSDDEESEDESEEEDEDDDSEDEDDDEDDDDSSTSGRQRTVPYSKLKTERGKRKALEGQIADINETIAELRSDKSGKSKEEELSAIQEAAKEIGEELNLDSKGLEKVLSKAVELAKKEYGDELPKDLEEKLKLLDEIKEQNLLVKEEAHFDKEWTGIVPALKKKYPNATDAMLTEAKQLMDDLSHGKKHHKHDLDYILFKNPKKFATILKAAPKNKSGETGKRVKEDAEETSGEEKTLTPIENMTPELMKKREQEDQGADDGGDEMDGVTINEPIE